MEESVTDEKERPPKSAAPWREDCNGGRKQRRRGGGGDDEASFPLEASDEAEVAEAEPFANLNQRDYLLGDHLKDAALEEARLSETLEPLNHV
jgi:hypothetical protein